MTEKIEHVLSLLGIEADHVDGDEVYAPCPGHMRRLGKVDRSASWSINVDSRQHFCFSCGYKGNLVGLVVDLKQFTSQWGTPDWAHAKAWLEIEAGSDISDLPDRLNSALKNTYVRLRPVVPMTESRLALFVEPPDSALKARGLTADACRKYGVLWDDKRRVWITPIRHPISGALLGWQEKGEGHRHFRNRPANVRKSTALFGLQTFTGGIMLVVESPLDAVRLESVGIPGGVATYGAMISAHQIELMMAADDLIIAMDNPHHDKAGLVACRNILEHSRRRGFEFSFFGYLPNGAKDPGDMTAQEIISGVKNRRHCIAGERAITGS